MGDDIWAILGIAPSRERDAIRRAYARRLKVTSPEDDAEAFQALRQAYEQALERVDHSWTDEDDAGGEGGESAGDLRGGFFTLTPSGRLVRTSDPDQPAPEITPGITMEIGPEVEGDHERAMAELLALLEASPPAAPQALEAAFAALMAQSTLQGLAVADWVERRIARLILDHAPASDPLVRPAIAAFGWDRERVGTRNEGEARAVVVRDGDIVFRDGALRGADERRPAFLALRGRAPSWPRRLSPDFETTMRDLIRVIDHERPGLRADVDPAALDDWRRRLGGPHLPVLALWSAVLAPPMAVLVAFALGAGPLAALGVYAGGVALALLAGLVFGYVLAPLRRAWVEGWSWRAPLVLAAGWAPAGWALMILAGASPTTPPVLLGAGVAALLLTAWAGVTGDRPEGGDRLQAAARTLLMQALLACWWLVTAVVSPEATPWPAAIAFLGLIAADALGGQTLASIWYARWRPWVRNLLRLAMGAAAFALAWRIVLFHEEPGQTPLFVAMTMALVVAHRPSAAILSANGHTWRFRVMAGAAFGLFKTGFALGWPAAGSLWLLVGVVVTLVAGALAERDA